MTKLKVGLLLDDSLDRPDGVQQYVLTLGQWLTNQGHEVHYLVGQTKRTDIQNIHSLSLNLQARFNQNRLTVPLAAKSEAVQQTLDELNLDVLHVQLPCHPLLGSRIVARVNPKTAVVGTFHIMPSGFLSKAGTKLLGTAQKRTLSRFDSVVAVSEPAKEFAQQNYHANINAVIPNMVDTAAFKIKVVDHLPDSKRIVFLGRLVERKGCLYLLKALSELKQRTGLPSFHVQIGGSGPLDSKLKSYVIENGLQDITHFLGFVDDESKARFLAQADIAVFPSTGGESFGIVLIEAMAAGAGVVIGGNNPGYASVLGTSEHTLFDPKNTQEFSNLLADLLQDPLLTDDIHSQQRKLVKRFDVNVVGAQIIQTYKAAIAKRRQSADNNHQ